MANKTFKTLDEQIELLQNKGLEIEDIEYAKRVILRENYFFLMGYRHLFMNPNEKKKFIKGATFSELYSLFYFDRQLRNIIFKNILIIENNCKSIFSYVLSSRHGYVESDYLKPENYNYSPERAKQVNDLLRKMKRQIRVNGSQHDATKHYISNYGFIPLWVVVKVLSFGITSELFTIMKRDDQQAIADEFGVAVDNMLSFLPVLSNYRNLCAHEDILFEHRTQKVIPNNRYHKELDIPFIDHEYIYGKGDLFAVVIIFKYLLSKDDFRLFINEVEYELSRLDGKLHSIPLDPVLDRMGFPKNYSQLLNIN
jgi:abortive infection bacteriophage resistance protein